MDTREIRGLLDELAAFMKENALAELELDVEGAHVKLKKTGGSVPQRELLPGAPLSQPPLSPSPAVSNAPSVEPEPSAGTFTITSPMVGTFYLSAKPDADPLVNPGDTVDEDTVVCIIEAMKVMNEIRAERKGRVAKILVENGEPVEYGQPLFLLTTTE